MFEQYSQAILDFTKTHQTWAALIVFALTFAESIAFFSALVPAWALLVGIGFLIGAGDLSFPVIWLAGSLGAAAGDWASYELGHHFGDRIKTIGPLRNHADWIAKGEAAFKKYGVLSIFIGRFFGPLRATVPLIAGVVRMPRLVFQIANVLSAFLWCFAILAPGALGFDAWREIKSALFGN